MEFKKVEEKEDRYVFPKSSISTFGGGNRKKVVIDDDILRKTFNFAYDMTFGGKGEHRHDSFTGKSGYERKNGEIFVDTFQGKLSEFATYKYCVERKIKCQEVDLTIGELNYWDNIDMIIGGKNISIKSTKGYSKFLLLECDNYDEEGNYKHPFNKKIKVDSFLLCRVQSATKSYVESKLKEQTMLYSDNVDKTKLFHLLCNEKWEVELSGFLTKSDFKNNVIGSNHIMKKGFFMGNSSEKMKVDNYYVFIDDLKFHSDEGSK